MRKNLHFVLGILICILTMGKSYCQQILDDFNDPSDPNTVLPNTALTGTGTLISSAGTILGGERDIKFTVTSQGNIGSFNAVDVIGSQVPRMLLASTNAGTVLASYIVTYDGIDNDANNLNLTPGLGGINMMGSGAFSATMNIDALGLGKSLTLTCRVYSDITHWSDYSLNYIGQVLGSPTFNFSAPRTAFVIGAGATGPANFASVRAVQFILNNNQGGLDLAFLNEFTVPSALIPAPVLSNIQCNPNGTLTNSGDDFIQFNLLATSPIPYYDNSPYTYSVTAVQNGVPVNVTRPDGSPANNLYYFNTPTALKLPNGTSGHGNVQLTVTPNWGNYPSSVVTLSDPGSCTSVNCIGVGNSVSYTYEYPWQIGEISAAQVYIPKFTSTANQVLTGVTVSVNSSSRAFHIAENGAASATTYRGRNLASSYFTLNGSDFLVDEDRVVAQTLGYPSLVSMGTAVTVPIKGAWIGDSVNTSNFLLPSTLGRMIEWIPYDAILLGNDPTMNPKWVTSLTGISTDDDDMIIAPVQTVTYTDSRTLTASNAEFAHFQGTGNIPMIFDGLLSFSSLGGGGNLTVLNSNGQSFKVTVVYTFDESCINLSGNVFDDGNGNNNNLVDHTTSGSGINNPSATSLYANLLDASNNVVATVPVGTNGVYSFNGIKGQASYTIQISTNQGSIGHPAPATTLPSGWVYTGEQLGNTSGTGLDLITDGKYNVTVTNANVNNVNFGINKSPIATNKSYIFTSSPAVNTIIILDGTNSSYGAAPGLLSGTDNEDGILGNVNSRFKITSLPASATLKYWNGITEVNITAADINNGTIFTNPANLRLQFTGSGYSSVQFGYAFIDNAGSTGTSATYIITLPSPLPLNLLSFIANGNNCDAFLNWRTANEVNVKHFIIEQSFDGFSFHQIGLVTSGQSYYNFNCEQPKNIGYYRLKMMDMDNSFQYSGVVKAVTNCNSLDIEVFPNPATMQLKVKGVDAGATIRIMDVSGKVIRLLTASELTVQVIDISQLPNGMYTLEVKDADNSFKTKFAKKD